MLSLRRALLLALLMFLALPALAQAHTAVFNPASTCRAHKGMPVPQQPLDDVRLVAEHRSSRQAAEAGLRRAPLRLRRHRRPQHARRLQHPAADLDPVLGRRSIRLECRQLERLPDQRARFKVDRDQSDRVGAGDEHACTSSPTSSSASTRPTSSSSPPAFATRVGSRSSRRSSGRTCTAACPASCAAPGQASPSDVAVATVFTTQSVNPRWSRCPGRSIDPARRPAELRDRQRRRADGVPAGQCDVGRVLDADRHRADLRPPAELDAVPRRRRLDRVRRIRRA